MEGELEDELEDELEALIIRYLVRRKEVCLRAFVRTYVWRYLR